MFSEEDYFYDPDEEIREQWNFIRIYEEAEAAYEEWLIKNYLEEEEMH